MSAEQQSLTPGTEGVPIFLRDLWYMAALSRDVRKGRVSRVMLLGEPVALGRLTDGSPFALRDICPHRGVPLSYGRVRHDNTVECAYHGWRFNAGGVCTAIPSLIDGQDLDPSRIRVRSYAVREQNGLIWVYVAAAGREDQRPGYEPPQIALRSAQRPRFVERQIFPCGIDHAVIGLMDPAHGPYVHRHWWWQRKTQPKSKRYAPLKFGFVMTRHTPTKPVYRFLGAGVSTEISFELPSTRFESIRGRVFGLQIEMVLLTTCTPRTRDETEVTQTIYWPAWLGFVKPIFMLLGPTFLGDDRKVVEMQQEGLKFNPRLMLIQDADVPAMWYHRLKKAWAESVATNAPFVNPVQETTLRWRS
jgi:phenylpropionate dioxygenase-like ring-hydroxylating dioxygenase large terminal subunit